MFGSQYSRFTYHNVSQSAQPSSYFAPNDTKGTREAKNPAQASPAFFIWSTVVFLKQVEFVSPTV